MEPWSDLYALGCLAWSLMCGAPSHPDLEYRSIAAARVAGRMPDFEPLDPTRPAFVAWLMRLLATASHLPPMLPGPWRGWPVGRTRSALGASSAGILWTGGRPRPGWRRGDVTQALELVPRV